MISVSGNVNFHLIGPEKAGINFCQTDNKVILYFGSRYGTLKIKKSRSVVGDATPLQVIVDSSRLVALKRTKTSLAPAVGAIARPTR